MTNIKYVKSTEHDALIQQGYTSKEVKTFVAWGSHVYKHIKYTKDAPMDCLEKSARVGCGSLASLLSCCILPLCCNSFTQEAFDAPIDGQYTKELYVEDDALTQQWRKEDSAKLGFNISDQASVSAFAKNNIGRFSSCFGHKYLTLRGFKTGCGYAIIIPHGDVNQATLCTQYDNVTGKAITSAIQISHAKALCGAYDGDIATRLKTDEVCAYGALALLEGT